MIDLRPGDWREVLADVGSVDAVITDPPYSERTHKGHDDGAHGSAGWVRASGAPDCPNRRRPIIYTSWTEADVLRFVASWAPRCRGWFVAMTDHTLAEAWIAAFEAAGRYAFVPLPVVTPGSRVRLSGDGPALWAVWLCVSRPKGPPWAKWGALPGAYVGSPERRGAHRIVGDKPLGIMRRIVADYSRPGDLVCDPCAGTGTTLLAAHLEGRDGIGAELDPKTYELARQRLAHLPEADPATGQGGLFEEA